MDDSNVDIQIQLEGLRKDVENVNYIQTKIDTAIEKMTDVSSSIKSMLAVHEEMIAKQEQIDEVIFDKLKERQISINQVYDDREHVTQHLPLQKTYHKSYLLHRAFQKKLFLLLLYL